MKIWNWAIGKGKKHHSASCFIMGGLGITMSIALWIYENDHDAITNAISETIEWIIALFIAWAVWRFILFILNTWKKE